MQNKIKSFEIIGLVTMVSGTILLFAAGKYSEDAPGWDIPQMPDTPLRCTLVFVGIFLMFIGLIFVRWNFWSGPVISNPSTKPTSHSPDFVRFDQPTDNGSSKRSIMIGILVSTICLFTLCSHIILWNLLRYHLGYVLTYVLVGVVDLTIIGGAILFFDRCARRQSQSDHKNNRE